MVFDAYEHFSYKKPGNSPFNNAKIVMKLPCSLTFQTEFLLTTINHHNIAWILMQVVVSDVPSCGGVAYAKQHNIRRLTYPIPKKGDHPGLTKEQLVSELTGAHKVDYVILAGYLKVS